MKESGEILTASVAHTGQISLTASEVAHRGWHRCRDHDRPAPVLGCNHEVGRGSYRVA